MAVFKRRICQSCEATYRDQKESKSPPACKCGKPTSYMSWYVSVKLVQADGSKKPHTKGGFETKGEAKAYEGRLLDERQKGEIYEKPADTSFKNAAKVFLEWCDTQDADKALAEGSTTSYRSRLEVHLKPYFGSMDIRNIDDVVVDAYRVMRYAEPFCVHENNKGEIESQKFPTKATVNREVATLKRIMSIAVKRKLIKFNPIDGYSLPFEDNERIRFLTDEEIDSLLECCCKGPKYLRIAVLIALNTGLRKDGVLAMKRSDIDFKANQITRVVKHRRGKTPKIVRIPMNKEFRQELALWLKSIPADISGYIIPSPKKAKDHIKVTSNFGFETACRRAGIEDFTFHDLRHTFATHFLEAHPELIEVLSEIMGHSGTYMTRRYAHITDRIKQRVMEGFSIGIKAAL